MRFILNNNQCAEKVKTMATYGAELGKQNETNRLSYPSTADQKNVFLCSGLLLVQTDQRRTDGIAHLAIFGKGNGCPQPFRYPRQKTASGSTDANER